jgi:Fe-Mn family superoxide dismutase
MSFTLPPLPYPPDALEAAIDKMTMEIHHGKHHKAYVDNLNAALEGHADLLSKPIDQLLREITKVPETIRQKVINNGGGHANHTMFWEIMAPKAGGDPTGPLADAIKSTFTDFANFKAKIKEKALGQFGSGWAWLVFDSNKKQLAIEATPNQDSTILGDKLWIRGTNGNPTILGLDVWEHAYYLKYQNKRADYITAWWNVVNWDFISERYAKATA